MEQELLWGLSRKWTGGLHGNESRASWSRRAVPLGSEPLLEGLELRNTITVTRTKGTLAYVTLLSLSGVVRQSATCGDISHRR